MEAGPSDGSNILPGSSGSRDPQKILKRRRPVQAAHAKRDKLREHPPRVSSVSGPRKWFDIHTTVSSSNRLELLVVFHPWGSSVNVGVISPQSALQSSQIPDPSLSNSELRLVERTLTNS